jgi:hypothetical protein
MWAADMTVVTRDLRTDTLTGPAVLFWSMSERVTHDHPTIETVEATLHRQGGTTRPEIRVAEELDVETGELVRVVLDESEYRVPIEKSPDGKPVFRHANSSPRLARNPDGAENALVQWVEHRELSFGRTVSVDIVETGFKYGLRGPGESAVYAGGKPTDSLADIAKNLDS